MVPQRSARSVGIRTCVTLCVAVAVLILVSVSATSAIGTPGPGDSSSPGTSAADTPDAETAEETPTNVSVNETIDGTGDRIADAVSNTTDGHDDGSNGSGGVPGRPSNWSADDDERKENSTGGNDTGAPWTWEWSEYPESMTDGAGAWSGGWMGPPADEESDRPAESRAEPAESGGTTDSELFAASESVAAIAEEVPGGDGGDCGSCSVIGGVGVVIAVGVSRRVGTAMSLGVSVPQVAATPSVRTLAHWIDQRLPRLPPIVPGQYSRRDDSDPLAHARRSKLADIVAENPGIPLGTVCERMDVPRSSVRYHVRILEDERELETANVLGRRRLFPAGENPEFVAALADEGTRRIVTTLARLQPATGTALAEEVGKANSTVSYHLDRLAAAGVVERDRDGRHVYNRLADDVEELVADADRPVPVGEAPR